MLDTAGSLCCCSEGAESGSGGSGFGAGDSGTGDSGDGDSGYRGIGLGGEDSAWGVVGARGSEDGTAGDPSV